MKMSEEFQELCIFSDFFSKYVYFQSESGNIHSS